MDRRVDGIGVNGGRTNTLVTWRRLRSLRGPADVGVGVGVAVGLGVGVRVAVGVWVSVADTVGVRVGVGVEDPSQGAIEQTAWNTFSRRLVTLLRLSVIAGPADTSAASHPATPSAGFALASTAMAPEA
jgi:hypothetical protein